MLLVAQLQLDMFFGDRSLEDDREAVLRAIPPDLPHELGDETVHDLREEHLPDRRVAREDEARL